MHIILRLFGTAAAVMLTVYLVPGLHMAAGWQTAVLVALVWSAITITIRPVLHILALPITILTFGLFAFVLNALLFWALAFIVPGFSVAGFWAALLGAIVLSVFTWFINKAL